MGGLDVASGGGLMSAAVQQNTRMPDRHDRLPGDPRFSRVRAGGGGLLERNIYWLGPDHLLLVRVGSFVERYQRCFYRDIRAVSIRETRAWEWGWGLGLTLLAVLTILALLAVETLSDPGGVGGLASVVIYGSLALLVAIGLAVHGIRGKTCAVSIHTVVRSRDLPGVRRWWQAERLLDGLRPRIEAAQGTDGPAPRDSGEAGGP